MQIGDILDCRIVAEHTFRTVSTQSEHQKIAHTRQQIFHETSWLESADHNLLHDPIQLFTVAVDNRVDRLSDQRIRGKSEQCNRRIMGNDAMLGTHHQLVEHRQGVTYGAAARAHGELEHAWLRLDLLFLADSLEVRAHDFGRDQAERVMVGAGANRADHLVRFRRCEDEHDMFRRFLNDFEQRVEPLLGDHMRFVEDKDLVPVASGREACAFTQFAGIIDTVVACGVDFHDVDGPRSSCGEILAARAFTARMRRGAFRAVDASRENTRGTGFATSARPGEQVRMGEPVLVKRPAERYGHLILSDDPVERIGTIPSIQCQRHVQLLHRPQTCPTSIRGAGYRTATTSVPFTNLALRQNTPHRLIRRPRVRRERFS